MQVTIIPVTPYEQNCSLIMCENTKSAAVIDPGGDLARISEQIEKMGAKVEKILVTHGHFDHCGAAAEFAEQLNVPIEGPHKDDEFLTQSIPEWCQKVGFPIGKNFIPERWLEDGDTVTVGDETLDVVHCPGHTPGHVILHHKEDQISFVGDVLFNGSIGRTDFPRGNHADLIHSIQQKLFPLGDEVTFVPGHGPTSTLGHEKLNNPFVR